MLFIVFSVTFFPTYKLDWSLNFSSWLKYCIWLWLLQLIFSSFQPLTWSHWELKLPVSQGYAAKVGQLDVDFREVTTAAPLGQSSFLLQTDHRGHRTADREKLPGCRCLPSLHRKMVRDRHLEILTACLQNLGTEIIVCSHH